MAFDRNKYLQLVQQKANQRMLEKAEAIAEHTLCEEHRQRPLVSIDGNRSSISECCDQVRQSVLTALKTQQA